MATVTYYFNAYTTSGVPVGGTYWGNPSNAVDGSTSTYASIGAPPGFWPDSQYDETGYVYLNGTSSSGTSLGNITKVEMRVYGYLYLDSPRVTREASIQYRIGSANFAGLGRTTNGTTSAGWSSYIAISDFVSGYTGLDWGPIDTLKPLVIGRVAVNGSSESAYAQIRLYRAEIRVTYTAHVASTLTWSSPASGARVYRNKTLAISGTAANTVAGVNRVQYNIDGGSWVTATGTTSWSATIAAATLNALGSGSHTINTRVRRNGDNAYTTTTSRNFIISPLPAQSI